MKRSRLVSLTKKIVLLSAVLLTSAVAAGCEQTKEGTTVRLNEVVHSIFYAPQYVAIEKGFFKEEGLDIELSVGQGADARVT